MVMAHIGGNNMSRLGPTGLTQLLTNIKTWVTTKLGDYVTTNTTQTITGKKLFTNAAIQLDNVTSMSGSTMFIDTSAAAPRGEFPAEAHRVGRIYIGDNTSYNGAWFIVDPIIDTNKAYYRMVTTNPDNTDSTRFSIVWDGSKTGARCRKNVSTGDLLPAANNTYNLGADDLKWDIGYIHNLIGTNKDNLAEDANNYYSTTSGSHMTFYTTSNGSTTLSNVPAAVNTHLESRTIRYLSSSDWTVEQICHNTNGLYYRKGNNNGWGNWKTFAFTDSNITGTAANVTGTVAIANGGTGATTRLNAVKNLTNESVGTPTHFLAITTNYAKAGYTTVAQAKTVLGITGDMGSHSDSEYVHKTGDESISGAKTFSSNITINGTYLGTEASTNERTNIYLLANRDTADASGAYINRFRQNRTQGAMGTSDVSFISFDFLENSTRYTRCFTMGLTDWDSDGVPQTYWLSSSAGKGSLGTASTPWNKVYATNYYLGSTAFGDIVTHNASEFLASNGKAVEANKVQATIDAGTTAALVQGTIASNDCFRIAAGGAANAGWAEIATGDDANEPIYVRQYKGSFTTLQRTATLLDGSGNTSFPGTVTATGFSGPVSDVPSGTTYVSAVADGGAVVNSQTTGFGAIWRAPTKNYQVAAASWPSNGDSVYICYSVANTDVTAGNNTVSKSLIWNADNGTLTTTTFSGALSGNASSATQFSANTTVALTGDATGTSAGSKKGWSVPVTLANSGVTAGDYGPSEDASPAHSGTFTVPSITVDAKGRITAASTKTITLPSDNNTDTKVTQTVTTGNSAYPVLLCATANATATGTTTSRFSAGLTVNTRYSSIYITNKYDTANTKGVRNTSSYNNGILYFRSYDATQMGLIRCDSHKSGYQHIYMQATNYIKNGAIDPEGTATTCSIAVRVRDNGGKTIYTDGSWENSLTPYANNTYSLGTSSNKWKEAHAVNFYENGTALSDKYVQINSLAGGNAAGSLTHSIGSLVLARCPMSAFGSTKLYANVSGLQLYPCRTEICTMYDTSGTQFVPIVVKSTIDGNLGSGTWRYLGGSSAGFSGDIYGMFLRVA